MIHPNFLSAASRLELERCLRRHREEYGIARRANAILLLDKGKSCAEIAEFLYLDDDTIRGRYKAFRQEGWDALALDGRHGRQSRLTPDEETKRSAWLDDRFCHSAGEIRAFITAAFGLYYSHSGCLKMLGRLGFEYRKPRALPRVADEDKQAEFMAFYQDLMTKLPADEAVYFADAVHPEHQTKPAFGWVRKGSNPAVKTTAGRGRVTIHGARVPGKLRYAFRRTCDRRWRQCSTAFGKDRGDNPKQITYPHDLGQCGLPPLRDSQKMALTSKMPYPSDPVTHILPAPEPD